MSLFLSQGHTMLSIRWNVCLCCCDSTAANAAAASFPKTAMFAFSSRILASDVWSFVLFSRTGDSLTRDCLLEISAAC